MRCLLVLTVLVAAAGAASVSQSVSVGGSSRGGETVSVGQTSSSISSDTGETLGIRSSFSSKRRDPVAAERPRVAADRPRVAAGRPPVTAQKEAPVTAQRDTPVTAQRKTPVVAPAQEARPAAAQGAIGTGFPVVPAIRPLKINFNVPSLAPAPGGGLSTRFNSRGSAAAPAAVSPALAGAQANLNEAADELRGVMASLG